MAAFVVPLYALKNNGGVSIATVDLERKHSFLAWVMVPTIDSSADFDRDNAVAGEVYQVDGADHKWAWLFGGDHWGDNCAFINAHQGVTVAVSRRVTFRLRSIHH